MGILIIFLLGFIHKTFYFGVYIFCFTVTYLKLPLSLYYNDMFITKDGILLIFYINLSPSEESLSIYSYLDALFVSVLLIWSEPYFSSLERFEITTWFMLSVDFRILLLLFSEKTSYRFNCLVILLIKLIESCTKELSLSVSNILKQYVSVGIFIVGVKVPNVSFVAIELFFKVVQLKI